MGSDVLVIGGGVVGLGIARDLAARGRKVTLLESGKTGREASAAAAGMVGPQSEALEEDAFFRAMLASRDLFPEYAARLQQETGIDLGYHAAGALHLAFGAGYEQRLEAKYLWQMKKAGQVEKLEKEALLRRFPYLHPRVSAGYLASGDHWVNNEKLCLALSKACLAAGVEIHEDAPAEALKVENGRLAPVRAAGKSWPAEAVVLAAGAWSDVLLHGLAGAQVRTHPVRGQMLSFQVPAGLRLEMPVHAEEVYLVPRAPDRVLVGATVENVGFDRTLSGEGIELLLRGAFETVPDLRACGIDRLWTGFRPGTGDGWPFLGPSGVPGLHLAFGHYRRGILLLPLTIKALVQSVMQGSLPAEAEAFNVKRALH